MTLVWNHLSEVDGSGADSARYAEERPAQKEHCYDNMDTFEGFHKVRSEKGEVRDAMLCI